MRRFWDKVDKSGDCWEWTAGLDRYGYGEFRLDGKTRKAHRIVFLMEGVDIPSGMCVLHKCDNRKCVNPDHLFFGTPFDNAADMVAKGRQLRGSSVNLAKLNEDDIPLIRELLRYGVFQKHIAAQFGVNQQSISNIKAGVTWGHIT